MSFMGKLSYLPGLGVLFPSDEAEAHKANLAAQAAAYNAYRPELAQASQNALANSLAAYSGYRNFLAAKYGPGAVPGSALQTPMSPRMMNIGSSTYGGRGGSLGDILGGAAAGAGTGAMGGMAVPPYGPAVGAVGGGLIGAIAGMAKRGSVNPNDYGPFVPYKTGGR